jgi:Tfp pilus assembly major pilin PilA
MAMYKGSQLEKPQAQWTSLLKQPKDDRPSLVQRIVGTLLNLDKTLLETKGKGFTFLKVIAGLTGIGSALMAIKTSFETDEAPAPTKHLEASTDITKIKESEYQKPAPKKTVVERVKETVGLAKPKPAEEAVTAEATGFSKEVQKAITDAASKVGVSPTVLSAFIDIESKGNPSARAGSFVGLGQIGEPAWKEASKDASLPPITKQNDPRLDPAINAFATAVLLKQYTSYLQKNGVTPTVALLYTAHNLGPSRAVKLAKGEIDKGTEKAIANQAKELKQGGSKSYLTNVETAINKRLDRYAGAGGSTATPTKVASAAPAPTPTPASSPKAPPTAAAPKSQKVASAAPANNEVDPGDVRKPLNNEKPRVDYIRTASGSLIEVPV